MEKTAWHDRLALVIAVASFLIQIGFVVYWTGRFAERLDQNEAIDAKQTQQIEATMARSNDHEVSLAVINTQYTEIITRLGRLDAQRNPQR